MVSTLDASPVPHKAVQLLLREQCHLRKAFFEERRLTIAIVKRFLTLALSFEALVASYTCLNVPRTKCRAVNANQQKGKTRSDSTHSSASLSSLTRTIWCTLSLQDHFVAFGAFSLNAVVTTIGLPVPVGNPVDAHRVSA